MAKQTEASGLDVRDNVGDLRYLPVDAALDLACDSMGLRNRHPRLQGNRQETNDAAIARDKAQFPGWRPRRCANDLLNPGVQLALLKIFCIDVGIQWLQVGVCRLHLRHMQQDGLLDLVGNPVTFGKAQIPGNLEVQRDLAAAGKLEDGDIVSLVHARDAQGRGEHPVSEKGLVPRFDMDHNVAVRQNAAQGVLNPLGRIVALDER
ncbi:MAG: hypothetical protein QOJ93_2162 [Actinomycetota bacterium]|nr:hypothetical protein [Actinomycetota bacterium]